MLNVSTKKLFFIKKLQNKILDMKILSKLNVDFGLENSSMPKLRLRTYRTFGEHNVPNYRIASLLIRNKLCTNTTGRGKTILK